MFVSCVIKSFINEFKNVHAYDLIVLPFSIAFSFAKAENFLISVSSCLNNNSNVVLDTINDTFDFVFSCPPYADLEVYSDLEGDISNMEYDDFMNAYTSIIHKSCSKLKDGGLACFVVGEIRDKKGFYRGFVPDTFSAFTSCGMKYYNEAVLLNSLASAMLRASGYMKTKKLVKSHQNILVFKK